MERAGSKKRLAHDRETRNRVRPSLLLPPPPLRFGIINSASAIGPWHTGWIVNSKPTGMHIFRGYKRVQGQGFFARYSPVVRADTNGTHGWALRVPSSWSLNKGEPARPAPEGGGGSESLLFEDEGKCTSRSQHLRETRITDAIHNRWSRAQRRIAKKWFPLPTLKIVMSVLQITIHWVYLGGFSRRISVPYWLFVLKIRESQ